MSLSTLTFFGLLYVITLHSHEHYYLWSAEGNEIIDPIWDDDSHHHITSLEQDSDGVTATSLFYNGTLLH